MISDAVPQISRAGSGLCRFLPNERDTPVGAAIIARAEVVQPGLVGDRDLEKTEDPDWDVVPCDS
jgi:hypothetical protein